MSTQYERHLEQMNAVLKRQNENHVDMIRHLEKEAKLDQAQIRNDQRAIAEYTTYVFNFNHSPWYKRIWQVLWGKV